MYRIGLLATGIALTVAIVAGSIALISYTSSQASARATKEQAACINRLLADRNGTSAADEAAHAKAARADADWSKALTVVLTFPSDASQEAKGSELAAFLSAQRVYSAAMDTYSAELATNQKYRADHPLGQC